MNKFSTIEIASGYPRDAPMSGAQGGEGENVITVQRIVGAVRRRLGVMLAVFALTFAIVALHTFQLQLAYTATSRVVINSRDQNVVDIGAVISGMPANVGGIETEAEILRSRTLIEKLVKRLDLVNNPEFNAANAAQSEWDQNVAGIKSFFKGLLSFGSPAPADDALLSDPAEAERAELDGVISTVREAVWVNRLGNTFIIEISATSGGPKTAAAIANTLATSISTISSTPSLPPRAAHRNGLTPASPSCGTNCATRSARWNLTAPPPVSCARAATR